MADGNDIKREMLQDFAEAYRAFGLSKLMGRVVALLIYSAEPLSLDEIASELEMSKGPISQITRRLRDRNLIRRVWRPGSRKDYYEIMPTVFENAFRNNLDLIHHNTEIAANLKKLAASSPDPAMETLQQRLILMEDFYKLMETHFQNFLKAWAEEGSPLKVRDSENGGKS
ncbi:MAG: MarR family transcriptional regulator [Calditrichaeota bacterium]|nr:MarR family transcriptional regulator [Calditrichota bacterium]HQU73627.1 MarR family transcriptional regulator [Calditrichia bacterium]